MHLSDQEQKQLLKDWWKKYGNTILIALLAFALGNFSWQYWQQYKHKKTDNASLVYVQMINAREIKKPEEALLFAKHLVQDFASTPYASLAAFTLAQDAVVKNNLTEALAQLNWIVKHSCNNKFRQIARLRAARILLAQGKAQDAVTMLSKVDDQGFLALIDEVKGDALMALNKKNDAAKHYQDALRLQKESTQSPLLEYKLEQQ
jgi:predicted negative regulator of RcsB-dependent stress response